MKGVTARGAGHARPKSLLRKGLHRKSSRALSTYRTSQKPTLGDTRAAAPKSFSSRGLWILHHYIKTATNPQRHTYKLEQTNQEIFHIFSGSILKLIGINCQSNSSPIHCAQSHGLVPTCCGTMTVILLLVVGRTA